MGAISPIREGAAHCAPLGRVTHATCHARIAGERIALPQQIVTVAISAMSAPTVPKEAGSRDMSKLDQLKALGDAKRASRESILPQPLKEVTRKTGAVATESGITTGRRARADRGEGDGMETPPLKSRRGRPRIGEQRDKPWERSVPRISERTWYRRKREAEKAK